VSREIYFTESVKFNDVMSSHITDDSQSGGPFPADTDELPPSAMLVLQSLHRSDGHTTSELAEEADLAERTIRYALSQLDKMGFIESRYLVTDPQTRKYMLASDDQQISELLDQ
jgi:DNA-binding MarR family transcriptional regulator